MMMPEKLESGLSWTCRKCGHTESAKGNKLVIKEEVKQTVTIPVFDVEKTKDKLSTIEADCNKCGGNQALWWLQQTRSGDEPATRFYKCIKCSNTWREYS